MKLVLFDCDGTIVDSADFIHRCMVTTFADAGLAEPAFDQTRGVIGLSLDRAIAVLADALDAEIAGEAALARMVAAYKQAFFDLRSSQDYREPLYEGMDGLIGELAARDEVLIGMVTGKSRRGVDAVLKAHDLTHHFIVVRTADDCPSKPHPAMVAECIAETGADAENTYVIGDAVYDMQMARAAGARAVGVSWGYHHAEGLRENGAEHVLERPDDFMALIDGRDMR